LADEQRDQSAQIYDESARALSNVEGIKLPFVDLDQLGEQASSLTQESTQSLNNVQQKVDEGKETQHKAEKLIHEMGESLKSAEEKQKYIDRQMQEVEQYHSRANDAFDQATKTWNEAKDSHESLTGQLDNHRYFLL